MFKQYYTRRMYVTLYTPRPTYTQAIYIKSNTHIRNRDYYTNKVQRRNNERTRVLAARTAAMILIVCRPSSSSSCAIVASVRMCWQRESSSPPPPLSHHHIQIQACRGTAALAVWVRIVFLSARHDRSTQSQQYVMRKISVVFIRKRWLPSPIHATE